MNSHPKSNHCFLNFHDCLQPSLLYFYFFFLSWTRPPDAIYKRLNSMTACFSFINSISLHELLAF